MRYPFNDLMLPSELNVAEVTVAAPENGGVNVGNGQFAPRVGLAYRLDNKTVIRVGYGMSVDPNSYRAMRDAYPATIAESISGTTSFQAAGSLVTGIPPIVGPNLSQGTFLLPTNITTTTIAQNFRRGLNGHSCSPASPSPHLLWL